MQCRSICQRKLWKHSETLDRRSHNNGTLTYKTDKKLTEKTAKFQTYIGNENIYCIPLGFLVDNGFVNQVVILNLDTSNKIKQAF